jgi:general stress protein YciG
MAEEAPKKKRRGGGFASNPDLAREAGRKGGLKVRDKYGAERYADIGRQGGETVRDLYGSEHFREIGSKGGKVSTRAAKPDEITTEDGTPDR